MDVGDLEKRVLDLYRRYFTVKKEDVIEEIRVWVREYTKEAGDAVVPGASRLRRVSDTGRVRRKSRRAR